MTGNVLWVPERRRTAVQLKDRSYLRFNENTSLEVLTLEDNSFQFYLTSGHAYVNFKAGRGSFLQMDTPLSSIRSYDPSLFRIDISEDDLTQISVFRGKVDAETDDGKITVSTGNTLSLGRDHYAELSPLAPPDAWERWNKEKDRTLLARRDSDRYLPDELRPYSHDLDQNGKWVYVREYGNVWTPTVVVSAGWAPYRTGRWAWIGGDYVWVSYEPWGWCPYHYGRWAFGASIGWFWVPPVRGAVYWGPGFVGWVYTPTYVSWVPLAPREIYYGYGYHGPYSVNITRVNITNIQVNKIVYRNVNVHNSVTVVHHDTFVRGKHVDVRVDENPFRKERINIGRPNIKPERETRMPVFKEIPDRARPPQKVRDLHVKELKERRPLIKERNISVLAPESSPKELKVKGKGAPAGEKRIEKGREVKPSDKGSGKPRAPEELEKSKGSRPSGGGAEKPKEFKPQDRGNVERPREGQPGGGSMEKSRSSGPGEKGLEKPKESRAPGGIPEKPKEFKPQERGNVEGPREVKPGGGSTEKPRSYGPVERGMEKQQNGRHSERGQETPKEMK